MARSSPGGKDCISELALIYRGRVSVRRPVCHSLCIDWHPSTPIWVFAADKSGRSCAARQFNAVDYQSTEATDQRSDGHIGNAGENVGKPGLGFDPVHNWRSS